MDRERGEGEGQGGHGKGGGGGEQGWTGEKASENWTIGEVALCGPL